MQSSAQLGCPPIARAVEMYVYTAAELTDNATVFRRAATPAAAEDAATDDRRQEERSRRWRLSRAAMREEATPAPALACPLYTFSFSGMCACTKM